MARGMARWLRRGQAHPPPYTATMAGCASVLLVSRVFSSHMARLHMRRKVTACLPGFSCTCRLVVATLQEASRMKRVCREVCSRVAREASRASTSRVGSRAPMVEKVAWRKTPVWATTRSRESSSRVLAESCQSTLIWSMATTVATPVTPYIATSDSTATRTAVNRIPSSEMKTKKRMREIMVTTTTMMPRNSPMLALPQSTLYLCNNTWNMVMWVHNMEDMEDMKDMEDMEDMEYMEDMEDMGDMEVMENIEYMEHMENMEEMEDIEHMEDLEDMRCMKNMVEMENIEDMKDIYLLIVREQDCWEEECSVLSSSAEPHTEFNWKHRLINLCL